MDLDLHSCKTCGDPRCIPCGKCNVAWWCETHRRSHQAQCPAIFSTVALQWDLDSIPEVQALAYFPGQRRARPTNIKYMTYDNSLMPLLHQKFGPDDMIDRIVVTVGRDNRGLEHPIELWYSQNARDALQPRNTAVEQSLPADSTKTWYGKLIVLMFSNHQMCAYSDYDDSVSELVSNYIFKNGYHI